MSELLTASQVAARIGKTSYTIKRWYNWYATLTEDEINKYKKEGMPELPPCQIVGTNSWRYWYAKDIEQLEKFSKWVPHTRRGIMNIKEEN